MYNQRINITMPEDLLEDLRMSIPKRSRSKFIAQAVKEKLGKKRDFMKEWIKSLKANREFYNQESREIEEDYKYADAEILEKLP